MIRRVREFWNSSLFFPWMNADHSNLSITSPWVVERYMPWSPVGGLTMTANEKIWRTAESNKTGKGHYGRVGLKYNLIFLWRRPPLFASPSGLLNTTNTMIYCQRYLLPFLAMKQNEFSLTFVCIQAQARFHLRWEGWDSQEKWAGRGASLIRGVSPPSRQVIASW